MGQIFISYSRSDQDKVKEFAEVLQATGNDVWIDQQLTGGQRWWDNILENIRQCEVFVVAVSPKSLDSHACKLELSYAVKLGKGVIPLLISDEVNVNQLPSPLNEIQYVDCRRQDKAVVALLRAMNNLPRPAALPDQLPESPPVPVSYLSNLRDKVDTSGNLSLNDQIGLACQLRNHLEEGGDPQEIRELLLRLRKRHDLFLRAGDEIDAAMAEVTRHGQASIALPEKPPTVEPPRVPVLAPADRVIELDKAHDEIERVLAYVLERREVWVIQADDQNCITLEAGASGKSTLVAKAAVRQKLVGSAENALKALGWNTGGLFRVAKGLMAGAAVAATYGLALLNKDVRNFFLSYQATREWMVTDSKRELIIIASELRLAMRNISSGCVMVTIKKMEQ